MEKLISFINAFLSYGALFCFILVLCVIAAFTGIYLRKNKDAKNIRQTEASGQNS